MGDNLIHLTLVAIFRKFNSLLREPSVLLATQQPALYLLLLTTYLSPSNQKRKNVCCRELDVGMQRPFVFSLA